MEKSALVERSSKKGASLFSKEGRSSLIEEFIPSKDKESNCYQGSQDLNMVMDELETKISTVKKQNSNFISSLDDLNDKAYQRTIDNRNLKLMLKHLEKEEELLIKERAALLVMTAKLGSTKLN